MLNIYSLPGQKLYTLGLEQGTLVTRSLVCNLFFNTSYLPNREVPWKCSALYNHTCRSSGTKVLMFGAFLDIEGTSVSISNIIIEAAR
jgi:hypothetical protein